MLKMKLLLILFCVLTTDMVPQSRIADQFGVPVKGHQMSGLIVVMLIITDVIRTYLIYSGCRNKKIPHRKMFML